MKRFCLALLLVLCVCLGAGCNQRSNQPPTETTAPVLPSNNGTTTLMVYMVGSDLEAKGGAGTNDLKEMAESGLDTEKVNLLVYAGGSGRWHNDNVSKDDGHTLLKLSGTEFETVTTWEDTSMGEPIALTNFLNYSFENYPADQYALILWDHGNGPVIGYGKDILFDNDSLTLAEMRTAMDASAFHGENKLAWVGFDACLMASAELACVWADYADYLISSQEIEPSFGWNYDFLSQLTTSDTVTLANTITENYMAACLAYYERKGYDDRDTTLSCMDLSKAGDLEAAIEALFAKAAADVDTQYNQLSVSRVNSRALGRASTGSEYDLIDLMDMAQQMKTMYPDEAEALQKVLGEMTVANATNAENLCGLSLYYPFYNKGHYEKSWGQAYGELNVFSNYAAYLDSYSDIWLKDDMLQASCANMMPAAKTANEFTLELTDAQAETFADAKYYILRRAGDQLYNQVYSSGNVTKDGNTLVANFDGQVLCGKTRFGEYWILNADEHDTVGDITRYSVYVNLTNQRPVWGDEPEGYESKVMGYRFHLSANNKTKTVNKSALVRYDVKVDSQSLAGGKLEEADLTQWSQFNFLNERHRYMARYENGVLKPLDQWQESGFLSGYAVPVEDLDSFTFAPIPDGEYYVLIEIEDVQGNRYCSELLQIHKTGNTLPQPEGETPIEVSWSSGDSVKLFEKEGVSLYLTTVDYYGDIRYTIKAENKNNYDVAVLGLELGYNDQYLCSDGSTVWYNVPANGTGIYEYGFDFGDAQELELMDNLQSIQLGVRIKTASGDRTMVYRQMVSVALSEQATFVPPTSSWSDNYYRFDVATRDMLAGEQVLFSQNDITCTLLGMGGDGTQNGKIVVAMQLHNTGSQSRNLRIDGFIFDGIFVEEGSGAITIYPGMKQYLALMLLEDELDDFMISSPVSVSVQVCFMEFATLQGGGGFSQMQRYPIALSQKGSGCNFTAGKQVVFNENGIRMAVQSVTEPDEYFSNYVWMLTVENDSGEDIIIDLQNAKLCGNDLNMDTIGCPVTYRYGRCGAGEKTVFRISCEYSQELGDMELSFTPVFFDALAEKELYIGNSPIVLKP